MTTDAPVTRQKDRVGESQRGFRNYRTDQYAVGAGGTLAGANLEEGDAHPDDSDFEIISAQLRAVAAGPNKTKRFVDIVGYSEDVVAAGSPWSELKGPGRIIEDGEPAHIDYVITFTGATAATIPAVGDKYATLVGSGTLPSTGLLKEPEVFHVSKKVYVTPNKAHVTVRFRGFYVTAAGSPWSELSESRQLDDHEPDYIDYVIDFIGAWNATVPTIDDTYATLAGSGSLPSTGLDTEPKVVHHSEKVRITDDLARVRVRFRAWYVTAAGSPWSELSASREIDDQYPIGVEYAISFIGASGAARPKRGDLYATLTGAGSISNSDLDFEPSVVRSSQRVRVTSTKSKVTVGFRGSYKVSI